MFVYVFFKKLMILMNFTKVDDFVDFTEISLSLSLSMDFEFRFEFFKNSENSKKRVNFSSGCVQDVCA